MGKPTIRILGAYQVELTEDLFRHAMESKYGGLELSKSQAMQTERYVREELSSVASFEVTGSCHTTTSGNARKVAVPGALRAGRLGIGYSVEGGTDILQRISRGLNRRQL